MIITNKKVFAKGMVYMASFAVVFVIILMPIFPADTGKTTGLDYADNLFNRLSKGSSWFVPALQPLAKNMDGKNVDLVVSIRKAALVEDIRKVLTVNGAQVDVNGSSLTIKADLGVLLGAALADSEAGYYDKPAGLVQKYGVTDGYIALNAWWAVLQPMIKELQKTRRVAEAQAVDAVMRKGIEPAYNFRGIGIGSVRNEFWVMSFLLVFYVVYTLWYGFAIFDLFEGCGLTMKKGKKVEG